MRSEGCNRLSMSLSCWLHRVATTGACAMFLTFATIEERAEFLSQVAAERADLLSKLYSSEHQPTIVGRGLSDEEAEWLKQRAGQRAKVHPDVKFSPMK
jgi:hypothetical protein